MGELKQKHQDFQQKQWQQEDPTFAGPLAGIALGLAVYHVVEPEIKGQCDEAVYEEQCGMMEMVLEMDEIIVEVKQIRDEFSKYTV